MPKNDLPGYVWDERLGGGRYRRLLDDGRLGRIVSQREIVRLLRVIADEIADALGNFAVALSNGHITLADAELAGQAMLFDFYNAFTALGRGGWSKMNDAARLRSIIILTRGTSAYPVGELQSWREFMRAIVSDSMTEQAIRARAALYAGKAYARFWEEDRILRLQAGDYQWETWLDHDDDAECNDCLALAALGKVPLGALPTVPGAGDTRCLGACRCAIIYA